MLTPTEIELLALLAYASCDALGTLAADSRLPVVRREYFLRCEEIRKAVAAVKAEAQIAAVQHVINRVEAGRCTEFETGDSGKPADIAALVEAQSKALQDYRRIGVEISHALEHGATDIEQPSVPCHMVAELIEAAEILVYYGSHNRTCTAGPANRCVCGYKEAWAKFKAVRDAVEAHPGPPTARKE